MSYPQPLEQLREIKLNETLIIWVSHYLRNRKFLVRVNWSLSNSFQAPNGVPLGPGLFTVFVHSLPLQGVYKFLLYANDVRICPEAGSTLDSQALQAECDRIQRWSVANCLPVSARKCEVIQIEGCHINGHTLGENILGRLTQESDLGSIMSDDRSHSQL